MMAVATAAPSEPAGAGQLLDRALGMVLASAGTAARRWRERGGRRRPGAPAERGAGRAPSWRSRRTSS